MSKKKVHQLLHGMYETDAITNDAFQIQLLLQELGYESEIFANYEHTSEVCKKKALNHKDYYKYSSADNILIYHYATHSPLTELVMDLPDKLVIRYHNVTPHHYFNMFCENLSNEMSSGRKDLEQLKTKALMTIADSEFNRIEIADQGFKNTHEFPIVTDFSKYDSAVSEKVMAKYNDDRINIIFVGRIAPNKKYEDLIKTFYYFKEIHSDARLILVGSFDFSPYYYYYLKYMVEYLKLEDVIFTGKISDAELSAYYRSSAFFLCMSEHEGFCVPLLEAMHFGLPIMAYKATAVPFTLKDSGILFNTKDYKMVAESINYVIENPDIMNKIIKDQKKRLQHFSRDNLREMLKTFIEELN